jgi:hypothetical protein
LLAAEAGDLRYGYGTYRYKYCCPLLPNSKVHPTFEVKIICLLLQKQR